MRLFCFYYGIELIKILHLMKSSIQDIIYNITQEIAHKVYINLINKIKHLKCTVLDNIV